MGVFISGFRDTTRGAAPICMCHAVAARRPEVARFDSLLLSVLSKTAPTSSPEHTQAAFGGLDLRVLGLAENGGGFYGLEEAACVVTILEAPKR